MADLELMEKRLERIAKEKKQADTGAGDRGKDAGAVPSVLSQGEVRELALDSTRWRPSGV